MNVSNRSAHVETQALRSVGEAERLLSEGHVVCGRSRRMRNAVEGGALLCMAAFLRLRSGQALRLRPAHPRGPPQDASTCRPERLHYKVVFE